MCHLHLYILTAIRYTSDAASIVITFDSPCAASVLENRQMCLHAKSIYIVLAYPRPTYVGHTGYVRTATSS